MKTKVIISLSLPLVAFLQIGCGAIGSGCDDSIKVTGVDKTSKVKFEVEGINGHITESSSFCSYETSKIKLTSGQSVYDFNVTNFDTLELSLEKSMQIEALFPQFSDLITGSTIIRIVTLLDEINPGLSVDLLTESEDKIKSVGVDLTVE